MFVRRSFHASSGRTNRIARFAEKRVFSLFSGLDGRSLPVSRAVTCLVLALGLLLPTLNVRAETDPALTSATAWLITQRDDSGGFAGFSGELDPNTTSMTLLALVAAKNAGADVDLAPTLAYLAENALVLTQTGPGESAILVLALAAAGEDMRDFNGVNPLAIVEQVGKTATGIAAGSLYNHAMVVLALVAAGSDVPQTLLDTLRSTQIDDGSWSYDGSVTAGAGDTNTTALAIQALIAADAADDPTVQDALAYLSTARAPDGGYVYQVMDGAKPDANSTAMVLQALIATGADASPSEVSASITALKAFQNESGAFHYSPDMTDDNLFATIQVIPALAGRILPMVPAKSA